MPVQIQELVIRATINEGVHTVAGAKGENASAGSEKDKEEIIHECIERIMELLKTKTER
jgi:hypothetical protein